MRVTPIFLVSLLLVSVWSNIMIIPDGNNEQLVDVQESWRDWNPSYVKDDISADSIEKVLVLLVQTSDLSPKNEHSHDYFIDLLFSGKSGSMEDYYKENSRNQLRFDGTVSNWIPLSGTLASYDEDVYSGVTDEFGIGDGIEEALEIADSMYDYSQYDQDGDGIIDNLMVVFVGDADSSNGDSDGDGNAEDIGAIWPLKWELQSPYETADGVLAQEFFVCTEECRMGTFAHEFAHNLGLPDLYDTDYSSSGVDFWSIMASGTYGEFKGRSNPTHFDPWSKYKLGWISPLQINPTTQIEDIRLDAVEVGGDVVMINISPEEYFLIEYRDNDAGYYDRSLPTSGVLIWHIDESVHNEYGYDNSDENRPTVRLLQADGLDELAKNYPGDAGDVYAAGDRFSASTNPAATGYDGTDIGINLSIGSVNDGQHFAVLSFIDQLAYLYEIDWIWTDSTNDGFYDQIVFTYDIDTAFNSQDVVVKLIAEGVYQSMFYDEVLESHSISGYDVDEFSLSFAVPIGTSSLYHFELQVAVNGLIMDSYEPEHDVWLESPSPMSGNEYDEWFDRVEFSFQDTDLDGGNETVTATFEYLTTSPYKPISDVLLRVWNDDDGSNVAEKTLNSVKPEQGQQYDLSFDLRQSGIRPGLLNIQVYLVNMGLVEEVFSYSTFMDWSSVIIERNIEYNDENNDGVNDGLNLHFNFTNNYETRLVATVFLKVYKVTYSETELVDEVSFFIPLGPSQREHSSEELYYNHQFSSQNDSSYFVSLSIRLPDYNLIQKRYPSQGEFELASSAPPPPSCLPSITLVAEFIPHENDGVIYLTNAYVDCLITNENYSLQYQLKYFDDEITLVSGDWNFSSNTTNASRSFNHGILENSGDHIFSVLMIHQNTSEIQENISFKVYYESKEKDQRTDNEEGASSLTSSIMTVAIILLLLLLSAGIGFLYIVRKPNSVPADDIQQELELYSQEDVETLPDFRYLKPGGEYGMNGDEQFYTDPDGEVWIHNLKDGSFWKK